MFLSEFCLPTELLSGLAESLFLPLGEPAELAKISELLNLPLCPGPGGEAPLGDIPSCFGGGPFPFPPGGENVKRSLVYLPPLFDLVAFRPRLPFYAKQQPQIPQERRQQTVVAVQPGQQKIDKAAKNITMTVT